MFKKSCKKALVLVWYDLGQARRAGRDADFSGGNGLRLCASMGHI